MIPHPVTMSYEGDADIPSGLLREGDQIRFATLRLSDRGLAPAILAAVETTVQGEAFATYLTTLSDVARGLAAEIRATMKENAA